MKKPYKGFIHGLIISLLLITIILFYLSEMEYQHGVISAKQEEFEKCCNPEGACVKYCQEVHNEGGWAECGISNQDNWCECVCVGNTFPANVWNKKERDSK